MLFMRKDKLNSVNDIKIKNQERCAHFSSLSAFVCLIMIVLMLYMAITSQFSEQKTVYYMLFVLSLVSFCILVGITVYIIMKTSEKKTIQQQYEANTMALRRSAILKQQEQDQRNSSSSQQQGRLGQTTYSNQTYQNDIQLQC